MNALFLKALFGGAFFFFMASPAGPVAAGNLGATVFCDDLSSYFRGYYHQIEQEGFIRPPDAVVRDILALVISAGLMTDKESSVLEAGVDGLSVFLDGILGKEGLCLNLFTVEGSSIVHCWLGRLAYEKTDTRETWGEEIVFSAKAIQDLKIRDAAYALTGGRQMLDVGTREGVIYYNLEAFSGRAQEIFVFLLKKASQSGNKNKRYDPSRSNRARQGLYVKTWAALYDAVARGGKTAEEAEREFVKLAAQQLMDNSLYHELGHIFSQQYLDLSDGAEEEVVAFLTELRHGPLPQESLETLLAAAYQHASRDYHAAARSIIEGFLAVIRREQEGVGPRFENIVIRGRTDTERMRCLLDLSDQQIRYLGESVFQEIFAARRRHDFR